MSAFFTPFLSLFNLPHITHLDIQKHSGIDIAYKFLICGRFDYDIVVCTHSENNTAFTVRITKHSSFSSLLAICSQVWASIPTNP